MKNFKVLHSVSSPLIPSDNTNGVVSKAQIKYDLYSFDKFDTIQARRVLHEPEDIFFLV